MLFLVSTYWVWMIVAALVGGVIAHRSSWQLVAEGGISGGVRWAVIIFAIGVLLAVLHALPENVEFYLQPLLLLAFCCGVGWVLGLWLRKARPTAQTVSRSEAAADAAAQVAVEKEAFEPAADAAEARLTAATKAVAEARQAVEAKAAEEARRAASIKAAEEERQAVVAKAAEEARQAAVARAAEEARQAAAAKAAEEARQATVAKAAEEARQAAAARAAEEARQAAAARAAEEARQAAATKVAEEARQAAAAKAAEDAPAAAAKAAPPAADHPGTRPPGRPAPDRDADDLKLIKGIGPKNEKICQALGVWHFHQIADWTADEAVWVGHHMAFPGRIEREHWIAQARLLAAGGDTAHSAGVKSGAIVIDGAADAPLDAVAAAELASALPAPAAALDDEAAHAGRRPYGLAAPRGGEADDLKRIRGIGPQNEGRLHGLGIWHFGQIAAWSPDNVRWVGSYLAFPGRIDREKWIDQARDLAAGRESAVPRRGAGKAKSDGARRSGKAEK